MRKFALIMAAINMLLSIFALVTGEIGHATYLMVMAVYWRIDFQFGDEA